MKNRGGWKYDLICAAVADNGTLICRFHFSKGTLHSLKHGKNISTATLDDLCRMLDCRVEDIIEYVPEQ